MGALWYPLLQRLKQVLTSCVLHALQAQLTDCQPDHQASRLADPAAGSPAPAHLQHAQDPTNYAAMNALLKQLHLEWLQRHPGTHHDDAALNLAG
jgi:hypothetical protein